MQSESRREGLQTLLLGQVTSAVVPRMHPFQLYFACALLFGSLTIQGTAVLVQSKYTFFLALQPVVSFIVVLVRDCIALFPSFYDMYCFMVHIVLLLGKKLTLFFSRHNKLALEVHCGS